MSLVARIFTLIAAMLLLIAGGGLYNSLTLRQNRLQLLHGETLQLARIAELDIVRIIDGTHELLATLAKLVHEQGVSDHTCSFLEATASLNFKYDNLLVVDRDGIIQCNTSGAWRAGQRPGDPAFAARTLASANAFTVGAYGTAVVSGHDVLRVGHQIVDDENHVVGAIIAGINLTWLNTALSQWGLGRDVRIAITDRNGILVASHPDTRSVGRAISDDLKPFLSADQAGLTEQARGNGNYLYGYIPVGVASSGGLGVFVGRSATDAVADINRSIWLNIAGSLTVLILSGVFASLYLRRIVIQPLQHLLLVAGRWREGDWSARVGAAEITPEFDRLATAFDGLATEVSARDGLLQYRDRLLDAIAKCASELVRAGTLAEAIPGILQTMGEALGVDRIIVLELSATGSPLKLRAAWHGPTVPLVIGADYFEAVSRELPPEVLEWQRPMREENKVLAARRSEVTGALRSIFDSSKMLSNLQAPILVDGKLFGQISVDDCRTERSWTATEIEAVSVLANLIGATIARDRHLETLSNADTVVRNSPMVIYRLATNVSPPALTYLSQNVSILGHDVAEALADPRVYLTLIHPDDRESFNSGMTAAIAGGTAGSMEFRLVIPDGSSRWIEARYTPARDAAGRVNEITGVLFDVTERKASEDRLRFANTLQSTLMETMPDGVLVVDAAMRIASFNRHFVEMWRLPAGLVETKDDTIVLGAVTSMVKDPHTFEARVNYLYEHVWETARDELETVDGRFFDRHTAPLRSAEGKYLGRVWFFRDITRDKQAFELAQVTLERAQRQLQVVGLISKSAALISGDLTLLARELTERAAGAMGCERVNVWLYNKEETELRCIDGYEASSGTHSMGEVLREDEYRNEFEALKHSTHVAADDPLTDPRTAGYVETYLKPLRITSMLDSIIAVGERHLGLLCFEHVEKPHRWKQDEIAFARQLADRLGQAVLTWERRIEEEKRRSSETALAAAQAIAHLGTWTFDAVKNFSDYSEESFRILGVDPATFGRTYEDYLSRVYPDDRPVFEKAFAEGVANRNGYVVDYRLQMDDGRIKWVHDIGQSHFDDEGRHVRTAGTMQDITDRKTAEVALVDSELRLRTILDTALDGIALIDAAHRQVVQSNRALAQMLGREDLVGLGPEDAFPPEIVPTIDALVERMSSGEIKRSPELPMKRADGSLFYVEFSGSPLTLGGRRQMVGIFRDVTERRNAAQALQEERDYAAAVIDSLPGIFAVMDEQGRYVSWNRNLCLATGLTDEQLRGLDALSIVSAADRDAARLAMADAFVKGVGETEFTALVKEREPRIVRLSAHTIVRNGRPFLIIVGIDVTATRQAEMRLRASEERFRAVSGAALDAIILIDADGKIVFWNNAAERTLGYTASEASGRHLHEWLAPERYREKAMAGLRKFSETGHGDVLGKTLELEAIRKDGVEIPIELSVAGMQLGSEWHAVGILRDITERKRVEAQMARMARYDMLTGLINRTVFVEELEQEIARAERDQSSFAVLYLDLDHFKDVNDTLGHPAGDLLLQGVAQRLQDAIRDTDTVARFGGDEFAVIVSDITEPTDAAVLADRVLTMIGGPYLLQGNEVRTGASVGIATYGPESPDAEQLLAHADVALYRAKSEGRGTYRFFTEAMDADVRTRVKLASELRSAIALQQLFLVYQPQVDVETGRIVGVEALVRWRHPVRGVILPGDFISVAEASGSIVPLGDWVVREACRQMREWMNAGIAPRLIGINLSALQFKNPRQFEDRIDGALAETGVPPQRIEFELTESVLMSASQRHADALAWLRKRGFRIAIDDFGTGYSSLDYLRRFLVDRIKIAQQFMIETTDAIGSEEIVRAAVALARALKLDVVVEGVETEESLDLVKRLDVHNVQGFYYSRPVVAEEMTALLKQGIISPAFSATSPAG